MNESNLKLATIANDRIAELKEERDTARDIVIRTVETLITSKLYGAASDLAFSLFVLGASARAISFRTEIQRLSLERAKLRNPELA